MFNGIRRIGQPDVDADLLAPGEPAIPDHLKPYYEKAPGLTRAERIRIEADGGTVTMHPLRSRGLGPRDDVRAPEILSTAEYEHTIRLEQADAAHRAAQLTEVVASSHTRCDLCGEESMGRTGTLTVGDRELRLCYAGCLPLLRDEVRRREHAARIDELLG